MGETSPESPLELTHTQHVEDAQGGPKNGTIGRWRRRLECVVQQQGGHIERLMQKLQDVTVTLDNN